MITAFKFVHIAALSVWCAGLIALPLLLARHDAGDDQAAFARLRLATHHGYVRIVTPAAVIAVACGTVLMFLRGVFVPWMFAKLAMVGALVLMHAWIGHVTLITGERKGENDTPSGAPLVAASLGVMVITLVLVLGKPLLGNSVFPEWLMTPRGQPLPVDEVPIW